MSWVCFHIWHANDTHAGNIAATSVPFSSAVDTGHLTLLVSVTAGFVLLVPLQVREANQMVEEMMLLANVAVAEKIVKHFPSCSLLRRHPTPAPRQFEPILKAAAAIGLKLDVTTSKVGDG